MFAKRERPISGFFGGPRAGGHARAALRVLCLLGLVGAGCGTTGNADRAAIDAAVDQGSGNSDVAIDGGATTDTRGDGDEEPDTGDADAGDADAGAGDADAADEPSDRDGDGDGTDGSEGTDGPDASGEPDAAADADAASDTDTAADIDTTPAPDTTAPTVAFASPADGATLSGDVELRVDARDDRGVVSVTYTVDGTVIASAADPPFSATWDTRGLASGRYVIVAEARDAAGNLGSAEIDVSVARTCAPGAACPPERVRLVSPPEGGSFCGDATLLALTEDPAAIEQVDYFVNGVLTATARRSPWTATWRTTTAADGTYLVRAVVRTAGGTATTSREVAVANGGGRCDNAPVVWFESPNDLGYLTVSARGDATVQTGATDDVGVVSVRVFMDRGQVLEWTRLPFGGSTSVSALRDGTYELRAVAADVAGNLGEDVIEVHLDREAPAITISSPRDDTWATTVPLAATASDAFGVDRVEWYAFLSTRVGLTNWVFWLRHLVDWDAGFEASAELSFGRNWGGPLLTHITREAPHGFDLDIVGEGYGPWIVMAVAVDRSGNRGTAVTSFTRGCEPSARNACGGCDPLDSAPDDPCTMPGGAAGTLVCGGSDSLVCDDRLPLGAPCTHSGVCRSGACSTAAASAYYHRCVPFELGETRSPMRFGYVPETGGPLSMGWYDIVGRGSYSRWSGSVNITRAYAVGTTEVTLAQWTALGGAYIRPSSILCDQTCPVEYVSRDAAQGFANELSRRAGLPLCYTPSPEGCTVGWTSGSLYTDCDSITFEGPGCRGYRLLTDAEFEWANHASRSFRGTLTEAEFYDGECSARFDAEAWYCWNTNEIKPVAALTANALGLFDLRGNASEFVTDSLVDPEVPLAPPTGRDPFTREGEYPITRGGTFRRTTVGLTGATISYTSPGIGGSGVGFRLARTITP